MGEHHHRYLRREGDAVIRRNVFAGVLLIAGVLCIQLGTAGPLQNAAGILWIAALAFFISAVVVAIRGYRKLRQTDSDLKTTDL